ncbi:MAG: hypothetical protein R3330_16555 [Saprospiraceae bacterium]|nr:hypothetical protein [Saprospiraceae bacterium]
MDKKPKRDRKNFHEELEGFDIRVNAFGELESSFDIDKINAFLNEKVEDKKLTEAKEDKIPGDSDEEE